MRRPARLVVTAALLAAPALPAAAQPAASSAPPPSSQAQLQPLPVAPLAPPQRPRIGLALSGGGARGAAHIGVLKVLDELRVPVDCVAGTSMGAVVGGAFAAGTTPLEMEQLVAETDWSDVFTDRPPRGEIAVRRKQEDYKSLFAPEYGLRDGALLLPRGVVAGVTIESFLRQLAAPAAGVATFGALPVPFRAVAADIVTGQAVVLDRGSLMQAMRASMAVPGAVTPVEIDGRMLVDGGIADNLPIDVVRSLCADVVIAVNISTPALKRDEITSAVSVVAQLINLLGKETVDRQLSGLRENDVLVVPDLGDISAGSFDRQGEAIALGEAAAYAMKDALDRLALPEREYDALRKTQVATGKALGTVDEIRFEGLQRTNPEVLATLIESKPGEPLDSLELAADLRRIYGRGDFEAVDYRIEQGPGGRALVIPLRENSIGPDYLRFGLGLASDSHGESAFNALVSWRRTWLNRAGGEWLAELQVGRDNHVFSEFYQPLVRTGRLFVAPYGFAGTGLRSVWLGDRRAADFRVDDLRLGVDVGAALGTWGELRLGPTLRDIDSRVRTGVAFVPIDEARVGGLRLRLFADRYDTPWFPRRGHRVVASAFTGRAEAAGARQDYRRLEAQASTALSFGAHTIALHGWGGTALDTRLPIYDAFVLGGPFRLSGFPLGRWAGERAAFASLRYYHQMLRLPSLLGSGVYAGASLEAGRVDRLYDGSASSGNLWSGSLFFGAETFLGPAFVGLAAGNDGNRTLYLMIGAP